MTLIVSDNSPLNLLVRLGHADVLPALFQQVFIPPEVAVEMAHPSAPPEVRAFVAAPPAWLVTQTPTTPLPLPHLATAHAAVRGLRFHVSDAILKASLARHLAHRAAQTKGTP